MQRQNIAQQRLRLARLQVKSGAANLLPGKPWPEQRVSWRKEAKKRQ